MHSAQVVLCHSSTRWVGEGSSRVCALCVCAFAVGAPAAATLISHAYSRNGTKWQVSKRAGGVMLRFVFSCKPYQRVFLLVACSLFHWWPSLPSRLHSTDHSPLYRRLTALKVQSKVQHANGSNVQDTNGWQQ